MCGACGGGGRAGPSWEDAAGRLDANGARARARAVRRLLDGTRWRAEPWQGSWTISGPNGQRHHAADLDALFAQLPGVQHIDEGPAVRATAAAPAEWHVQAGLVWVAAVRAAGLIGSVCLPLPEAGLQLRLGPAGRIGVARVPRALLEVEAAEADRLLASLLEVATP